MNYRWKFRCFIALPILFCSALWSGPFLVDRFAPPVSENIMEGEKELASLSQQISEELSESGGFASIQMDEEEIATVEIHVSPKSIQSKYQAKIDVVGAKLNRLHAQRRHIRKLMSSLAIAALLCSIIVAVMLAALAIRSIKLKSRLRALGYDWITFRDAAMIFAFTRRGAFALPSADHVLVLPQHGPDAESLIRHARRRQAYMRIRARSEG